MATAGDAYGSPRVGRGWLWALGLGVVGTAALLPLDPWIDAAARRVSLSGDVRRELQAVQQFGQLTMSLLMGVAFALLAPLRWRRTLDWAAGAVIAVLATNLISALTGRARPHLGQPYAFVGPGGSLERRGPDGTVERVWASVGGYDLASFPSRHAAMAAVAACFLIVAQPRLTPLALALAGVVGAMRVVSGAHYASDVAAGLALGTACALPAMRGYWGTRALDWFWRAVVDRRATPAYPALRAACEPVERRGG